MAKRPGSCCRALMAIQLHLLHFLVMLMEELALGAGLIVLLCCCQVLFNDRLLSAPGISRRVHACFGPKQ